MAMTDIGKELSPFEIAQYFDGLKLVNVKASGGTFQWVFEDPSPDPDDRWVRQRELIVFRDGTFKLGRDSRRPAGAVHQGGIPDSVYTGPPCPRCGCEEFDEHARGAKYAWSVGCEECGGLYWHLGKHADHFDPESVWELREDDD